LVSLVSIVTERLGLDSCQEQGRDFFLFASASGLALWATQPPSQGVPVTFSLGVTRPGREANHSSPASAEVKNAWSYISTL